MADEDVVRLLAGVPLFSGLSKKDLRRIVSGGRQLSYDKGRKIVGQGDKGLGFYLILEGQVEVRRGDKTLAKLGPGEFFGEMSLLDGRPRNADVVSTVPTRCFALLAWHFQGMVKSDPAMALKIMQEVANRLRQTDQSFSD